MAFVGVCFCRVLCSLIKTQQLKTVREWSFWLGLTLLCSLLLVGATLLPRTAIRDRLVAATTGIRTQANQRGFYQFIEEHGAPSGSRTGFSENDRQLGGPLLDDDTVLFTAQQDTRHYWRVESKDFYSGKGWINTIREEDLRTVPDSCGLQMIIINKIILKKKQSSFICRIREIICHYLMEAITSLLKKEPLVLLWMMRFNESI